MMKTEASDEGFGLFTWGLITLQVAHTSAKTTQSEQGDVKEEGSVLLYATDD